LFVYCLLLTALQHQRALLLIEWKFLQVHQAKERHFHPAKCNEVIRQVILGPVSWARYILGFTPGREKA
jgi:hypothetical protein